MSISSSLNAGIAGLAANATRLAGISDNIANVNTPDYHAKRVRFEDELRAATEATIVD